MSNSQEAPWRALCDFVERTRQEQQVPGAAVGVWQAEAGSATGRGAAAGFGVTNVNHPLPVTADTLFQIGSITKTFTGTAVMRLVEAGQLELDAPIRATLPKFQVADAEAAAQATLRHLLTHTGGWAGDFFHDVGSGDDALARYVADMAGLPQLAPLGALWSYNNAGFAVAGAMMEAATGRPYRALLRELVLEPLKLAQVYFEPGEVLVHRFAVGHALKEGALQVMEPWALPRYVAPLGGVITRVPELLQYARFHLGDGATADGARLLSAETLAAMQAPQVTLWEREAWGLTWRVDDSYGVRLVEHGGGTKGQISRLTLAPQAGFALAICTNAEHGDGLVQAVRRAALQIYLGVDAPPPRPLGAAAAELAPFVGRYGRPFMEIELGLLGGRLTAQATYKGGFPSEDVPPSPPPPPATLDLCGPDRLVFLNGPARDGVVDALRRPDGSIGWLRVGGRLHRKAA